MKRLLKREITLVSTMVLNMHYCRILEKGEKLAAKDIPIADAKSILLIEDELRARIIRAVGHDFYPPDRIEKQHPSNYMISILKPVVAEPKPALDTKIKFKITIMSSIGSKAAEKNIHVDSKSEANILANKMIRDLGLKKATYKLS